MILYMIDTQGRARIGRLVKDEMARRGKTGAELTKSGVLGIATINRVKAGDPKITPLTLQALGGLMELPRDFLLYVGTGDIGKIEASARPDIPDDLDLIRWAVEMIRADRDPRTLRRRATD